MKMMKTMADPKNPIFSSPCQSLSSIPWFTSVLTILACSFSSFFRMVGQKEKRTRCHSTKGLQPHSHPFLLIQSELQGLEIRKKQNVSEELLLDRTRLSPASFKATWDASPRKTPDRFEMRFQFQFLGQSGRSSQAAVRLLREASFQLQPTCESRPRERKRWTTSKPTAARWPTSL